MLAVFIFIWNSIWWKSCLISEWPSSSKFDFCAGLRPSIGIWVSISKYNAGSGLSALSEKVGSHSFLYRLNTGSSIGMNELYQILFMVVVCLWGAAPQVTCLLFFLLSRSTVFCYHTTIVASTLLHFPQRDDVFMLHRILCPTMLALCFGRDSGSYFLRESIAMLLKLASDLPLSSLCLSQHWDYRCVPPHLARDIVLTEVDLELVLDFVLEADSRVSPSLY